MNVFAAFAVAILPNGRIAGVTRPEGGVGLPGGKVEPGETPVRAAIREAAEEGWNVRNARVTIHDDIVDGRRVVWILFRSATRRREWKERARGIGPIELTLQELALSGMGNDAAAEKIGKAVALLRRLPASASL
jgi:ADP-ribose pyrophosphatase YjhB (NUDIX family)